MSSPACQYGVVVTLIRRSSTRSDVVAYASMTGTAFRSSSDVHRETTGVPRNTPFANEGSPAFPFVRLRPVSRIGCTHGVLMAPLTYPRPVWHGPVRRPPTGGSGCGKGP